MLLHPCRHAYPSEQLVDDMLYFKRRDLWKIGRMRGGKAELATLSFASSWKSSSEFNSVEFWFPFRTVTFSFSQCDRFGNRHSDQAQETSIDIHCMEVCFIKLEVPWKFVIVVVGFVMIWVVRRFNEGCEAMCIDGVWTLCLPSSTALHILRAVAVSECRRL